MSIYDKALKVFSSMSDDLLIDFQCFLKEPEAPLRGLIDVRAVFTDIFGEFESISILLGDNALEITQALLEVITDRFISNINNYLP